MGHARLMRRAAIRIKERADLELDGLRVPCTLRRSSAHHTLALRVDAWGWVVVYVSVDCMADFVRLHQDWLRRQLNQVCRAEEVRRPGALLPYLGQRLRLEEARGIERPQLHADCLRVPDLAQAHESVPAWYRGEAQRQLAARLHAICHRHNPPLPAWRLSDARSRWSISKRGSRSRFAW